MITAHVQDLHARRDCVGNTPRKIVSFCFPSQLRALASVLPIRVGIARTLFWTSWHDKGQQRCPGTPDLCFPAKGLAWQSCVYLHGRWQTHDVLLAGFINERRFQPSASSLPEYVHVEEEQRPSLVTQASLVVWTSSIARVVQRDVSSVIPAPASYQ